MKKAAKSLYEGELVFPVIDPVSGEQYSIKAPCANLDNGLRVIGETAFLELLGRSSAKAGADKKNKTDKLPPFLKANNLQPFVSQHITAPTNSIDYITKSNKPAKGYLADLLPQVCKVYRIAAKLNALRKNQLHIVERCELISDALIGIAITALIDEATGYQYSRPKDNLQAMLELYVQQKANPWVRQYEEKFYKEIYRLRGWEYQSGKRTQALAYITVDIVYKRIQPGLWEELKKVNVGKKKKYFQFLTETIGNPHLQEHLRSLMRLMKTCTNWSQFTFFLNRIYPVSNSVQMDIFFDLLVQSPEDLEKYKDLVS